jgi:DNA-binding response OmpR family regulator
MMPEGESPPAELFARGVGADGRRLWEILRRRHGRTVSHESIRAALYDGRPPKPRRGGEKVVVHGVRRALRGTSWRIETVWGVGYRLSGAAACGPAPAPSPGPLPAVGTPSQRRILEILWARFGQWVSCDALMEKLYGDRDDPPFHAIIWVFICHLRGALTATPYRIGGFRRVGWRMISAGA